jgi:hypothetical protein
MLHMSSNLLDMCSTYRGCQRNRSRSRAAVAVRVSSWSERPRRNPAWPRGRADILRFFDGFDLVEPGLVPKTRWRPAPETDVTGTPDVGWCGVGQRRA